MTNDTEDAAVQLAYPIAIDSYDALQKRLDAVEKRCQELLTFGSAITLGFVSLFAGRGYSFGSGWFIGGMACCLAGIGLGIYARVHGGLILINPSALYKKHQSSQELEIKRDVLKAVEKHWNHNRDTVKRKHTFLTIAIAFFAVELILLSCWAAGSLPAQSHQNPCPPSAPVSLVVPMVAGPVHSRVDRA
jgi:hypothetical protein